MSEYILNRVGVAHADSSVGGGVSPLDVPLTGDPIKPDSSFIVATIRDRRKNAAVQRGSRALTSSDVSPVDVTITAVDMAAAVESISFKEKRTNGNAGVSAILQSSTALRLKFDTIAPGDTIDVDWKVAEHKPYRGATMRVLDASHVRLEWDGTLGAGESIDAAFTVWDYDNAGDDIKEVLFRIQRELGFSGENSREDGLTYDNAGNPITIRIRTFDSAANLALATEVADNDPLEAGELSRVKSILTWDIGKNRPKTIVSSVLATATNPDID